MEVVIVIALIAMLVGLTAVLEQQAMRIQETERVAELLRTEIVSARQSAMTGTNDGPWGVKISSGEIVQFFGATYDGRTQTFDKKFDFSTEVLVTGSSTHIFYPPFGNTTDTGTTTVSFAGRTYSVLVSKYGGVELR